MKSTLSVRKLDVGQLRLLHILCKNYNIGIEEVVNDLIKRYLEIHLPNYLSEILQTVPKKSTKKNKSLNIATICNMPTPGVFYSLGRGAGDTLSTVDIIKVCESLQAIDEKTFSERMSQTKKKLTKNEQISNLKDVICDI